MHRNRKPVKAEEGIVQGKERVCNSLGGREIWYFYRLPKTNMAEAHWEKWL